MKHLSYRIVSFLLILCVVADPVTATGLINLRSPSIQGAPNSLDGLTHRFTEEAMMLPFKSATQLPRKISKDHREAKPLSRLIFGFGQQGMIRTTPAVGTGHFLRKVARGLWNISLFVSGGRLALSLHAHRAGKHPKETPLIDDAQLRQWVEKKLFQKSIQAGETALSLSFVDQSPETYEQVAKLLLAKEFTVKNKWSDAEKALFEAHQRHPEHFARAIGRVLERNPWSLVARNEEGKVVGVVFSALVDAPFSFTLPTTAIEMTHASERDRLKEKNAYVDFWFTGSDGKIAEAMIDSSLRVVEAINEEEIPGISINRMYAYSNPRALHRAENMSVVQYARALNRNKSKGDRLRKTDKTDENNPAMRKLMIFDPAISFHLKKGAKLVWIFEGYPQIYVPWLEKQNRSNAIGSGYVFVMRYPINNHKPKSPKDSSNSSQRGTRPTLSNHFLRSAA